MIRAFNEMDQAVFNMLNGLAGYNTAVDGFIVFATESYLAKGLAVMVVWWGLWFRRSPDLAEERSQLLAVLFTSLAAIFAGRLLALTLPFRDRPLHDASVEVTLPTGMSPDVLVGSSSFPSDHAVLFFALATGIFLVHRVLGTLLIVHALLVVSLTRVYIGLHYPGDVLFGALLGVILVVALNPLTARFVERRRILVVEDRFGHFFYPVIFFLTFQIASMFDPVRGFVRFVYDLIS